MNARSYLDAAEISNFYPMCEIMAHDYEINSLGDLIRLLNSSDKPRTNSDPELKAAVYTMLKSALKDLRYKIYTGHYPRPRRLTTMKQVEMYLEQYWNASSDLERKQLLYFVH